MLAAAAVALAATAIMHLLLIAAPEPRVFFGWIIGLATVVAVVYPFSTNAPLSQKVATGLVNLVLGIAIGTLIGEVARARSSAGWCAAATTGPPTPSRTPAYGYS